MFAHVATNWAPVTQLSSSSIMQTFKSYTFPGTTYILLFDTLQNSVDEVDIWSWVLFKQCCLLYIYKRLAFMFIGGLLSFVVLE